MKRWMRLRTALALAVLIRLAVPVSAMALTGDKSVFHTNDTEVYVIAAAEMLAFGAFTTHGLPEISRTPGYPVLLLPGLQLGHLEWVTIALQALLSCCTVYLVYQLAQTVVARPRVAWWCALLYALDPLSIVSVSLLETETLFTCLTMLWLWLLCRYTQKGNGSVSLVARAAVVLAASVYVRPIAIFLPWVVSATLVVWAIRRAKAVRRGLLHAGLFLLIAAGLVGLWQLRNARVAGYSGFSIVSSTNLYFYDGAAVLARQTGTPMDEVQRRLGYQHPDEYLQAHPEQRDWSLGRQMQWAGREGLRIIGSAPLTYAAIHMKGMARLLLDPGAFELLKLYKHYPRSGGLLNAVIDQGLFATLTTLCMTQPLVFWSNVALGLWLGVVLCLAAVSVCAGALRRNPILQLAVLTAGYFLLLSGGPQSLGRFRHPIMPIICVLAGYGFEKIRAGFTVIGPR